MSNRHAAPSRAKGCLQRLALIAFGLLLVLLLEGILRLCGFGGHTPFLTELGDLPPESTHAGRLLGVNPAAVPVFFGGAGKTARGASVRREAFQHPKPADTLRVLFLGASSVEGFPLPRNLTAVAFLEQRLQAARPDVKVEVLNLGVTAVASFPVTIMAREIIPKAQPDLVLIYAGHNEFFGAGGMASTRSLGRDPRTMRRLFRLRQTGLADALTRLLPATAPDGEAASLIAAMPASDFIPPDDERHPHAQHSLITNLREIIQIARRHKASVGLCTLASNERHVAPFASDPVQSASAAFDRAQQLEQSGEPTQAAEYYRQARDLDAMPWRASRDKNDALRALAQEQGVTLVDVAEVFAKAVEIAPGWELFVDHVHPGLRGQALWADAMFDALRAADLLSLPETPVLEWHERATQLGHHTLEDYRVDVLMTALFETWPMKLNNQAAQQYWRGRIAGLEADADLVQAQALQAWQTASTGVGADLPVSIYGGAAAWGAQDYHRTRDYYAAAVRNADPYTDERCAARAMELLAAAQGGAERASWRAGLDRAMDEARYVETLQGRDTALLARSLALLYWLDNAPLPAGHQIQVAQTRMKDVGPVQDAWLRVMPGPEQLPAMAQAARQRLID